MVNQHELKIWPEYFKAMESGSMKFQIRKNDRNFAVNDCVILKEWEPESSNFTGKELTFFIKHIFHGGFFGLHIDYCILGLD
jgi:hypothetical protein